MQDFFFPHDLKTHSKEQIDDDNDVTEFAFGSIKYRDGMDDPYSDEYYDGYNDIYKDDLSDLIDEFVEAHDGNVTEQEIQDYVQSIKTNAFDKVNALDMSDYIVDKNNMDTLLGMANPELIHYDDTLCCNQEKAICHCAYEKRSIVFGDPKMNFMEIYEKLMAKGNKLTAGLEIYDYAYDWLSPNQPIPCTSCTYHGTYRCIPLRNWLRAIADDIHTGSVDELLFEGAEILPCENYTPKPNANREDVQVVQIHLAGRRIDQRNNEAEVIHLDEITDEKVPTLEELVNGEY